MLRVQLLQPDRHVDYVTNKSTRLQLVVTWPARLRRTLHKQLQAHTWRAFVRRNDHYYYPLYEIPELLDILILLQVCPMPTSRLFVCLGSFTSVRMMAITLLPSRS